MSLLTVKGIIIKSIKYSENDKIVTILTRDRGRITALAKGALRARANFGAVTRFLSCAEYTLYKGKGMYVVRDADFIRDYDSIEKDVEKLTYCSHFTDMMVDAVQEEQPAPKALDLFLYTINKMNTATEDEFEFIRVIFELRLVFIMGYMPELVECPICGEQIDEKAYFSLKNDGLCCVKHPPKDKENSIELYKSSLDAIRYIAYAKPKKLFKFKVSDKVLKNLNTIRDLYVQQKLNKRYTKIDMLKTL